MVPFVILSVDDFQGRVRACFHGSKAECTTYEFDGNLLVVQKVGTLEDNTKGALANLFAHSVVHAHNVRR